MWKSMKRHALPCAALLAALLAAGCGNLSKVDGNGTTASPVWPDLDPKNVTLPNGTYPDPRQLAMVKAGMTKDQLYHLLGRPHFLEGFLFVREWDYLFHLPSASGDLACQYKVLFDRDERARQFYWKDEACEAAAKAAVEAKPAGA